MQVALGECDFDPFGFKAVVDCGVKFMDSRQAIIEYAKKAANDDVES